MPSPDLPSNPPLPYGLPASHTRPRGSGPRGSALVLIFSGSAASIHWLRAGTRKAMGHNWGPSMVALVAKNEAPSFTRKRQEAVQGAGMVGPFHAPGAAESDASVRLGGRSHVPGMRTDRAQAEEAGIKKAKP
jgi:hypothetical protein